MLPDVRQQLLELALARHGASLKTAGGFGRFMGGRSRSTFQPLGGAARFPLPGGGLESLAAMQASGPLKVLIRQGLGRRPGRF